MATIRGVLFGLVVLAAVVAFLNVGDWLVVNQRPVASDAIIVLGGGSVQRIAKGVSLYKKGFAPRIITSGGVRTSRNVDQAQAMAQDAVNMGVPRGEILEDNQSKTTYQNAVYTKKIMEQHHFHSALVVSSNFHMRRVSVVFSLVYRGSGITLRYVAAPDSQFHPSKWWTTPTGRHTVVSELVLIPINVVQGIVR